MKNFDEWNIIKKEVNKNERHTTFHEGEIWWCSIGLNIGDEEDGKNNNFERPILVLKKFSKNMFIGIPLSTKIKEGKYYINFTSNDFSYSVLLSQTRPLSSKRLVRKISKLSKGKIIKIKDAYKKLLDL